LADEKKLKWTKAGSNFSRTLTLTKTRTPGGGRRLGQRAKKKWDLEKTNKTRLSIKRKRDQGGGKTKKKGKRKNKKRKKNALL